MRALLYALGLCALAAALEGVFAGGGIKKRLAELRAPRYAPPLWGWVLIGIAYYVMCFAVLYRLFNLPTTALRNLALALAATVLLANALWNYFFFRRRSVFLAFLLGLPYSVVAVALFVCLLHLDRTAALWWLPYVVYLFYASAVSYALLRLNRAPSSV